MKVAIIGAGAMGCLFAAKLAQAGSQVLLVDHDPRTVSAIRKYGVSVKEGRTRRRIKIPIRGSPGDLRSCELILVMVKAYSTRPLASELRGKVGTDSSVVTLQNGLANVEALSRTVGNRVLAGSTTEASLRTGPGEVEHTGRGTTLVGELDGHRSRRVANIVRLLRDAGFPSLVTGNVRAVIWSKAVLNSAINPVSALTRLRNGQLTRVGGLRDLMLGVLDEGVRVGGAEGVKLNRKYLSDLLAKVLRSTAQNRSSMLQDILNGRLTEVRQLNGAVVELGLKHEIETPLNSALLALVSGLESRSSELGL